MMSCKKCAAPLPEGARFCPACGKEQNPARKTTRRGNNQGSVFKLPNGKWRAQVCIGSTWEDGKYKPQRKTKTFARRTDAINALPDLMRSTPEKQRAAITLAQLYDKWEPTHRAGKSTMDGYRAAFKHLSPLHRTPIADIDVDDLQDCIDACGRGRRTQENIKALIGLLYKFGIPRQHIPENLNLGPYLLVGGSAAAHRHSFADGQIAKIKSAVGTVPGAEEIYCMIYLGFRPSEFFALCQQNYDPAQKCFTGGAKTEAGTARKVTVSPRIQGLIDQRSRPEDPSAPFFPNRQGQHWKLKNFTDDLFYPALAALGIDNPMVEIGGGVMRHKYTPHSCRHTFSTLMKKIEAPTKDKLELIGHTTEEMLRYYQDVELADLRRITDLL